MPREASSSSSTPDLITNSEMSIKELGGVERGCGLSWSASMGSLEEKFRAQDSELNRWKACFRISLRADKKI